MKAVVTLILSLVACNAFATPDYQEQAEAQFAGMSAIEAYQSNFKQRTMSHQMPGTSTWLSGREVCLEGNTVRSINPVSTCVEWTGKNDDGDVVTTTSYVQANNIFDGNLNGKCSAKVYNILSTPVNYAATQCILWSAKGGDDDNWEVRYFTLKSKAEDYGSQVTCAKSETYTASYPTTFKVDFYRNAVENQNYLGSHTYGIARCGGSELPVVEAH